jgi:two-component system sensor histidine kinase/response regulator
MTAPVAPPELAPGPDDLADCLAGPNGVDLVVEMAHDLRSPLTSILFLADALQRGESGAVSDAQRRALGLIYSAALSLCTAASDVVDLARGGNQLVGQEPQAFAVPDVLAAVRDMIQPIVEEKRLELRLVHSVPERRLGHPQALSRVLLNLATNAVKYTDAGIVEIIARPVGRKRIEFSVRDTGEGLDLATMRALSQPLRKGAEHLRHQFTSSGLGLTICRKLVTAMGGELRAESAPQRGTRFFFTLELPPA